VPVVLDRKCGLPKSRFDVLHQARLQEFETLRSAGHHAAAIYMAGYAVEALLKSAICRTLDTPSLPNAFKTHSLPILLFYAGLEQRLNREAPQAFKNFQEFCGIWNEAQLRYEDPGSAAYSHATSSKVESWLLDPKEGIVPWLKAHI
jgi:hypothetical protein